MATNKKNALDVAAADAAVVDAAVAVTPEQPPAKAKYEGVTGFVYVGPPLPKHGLKSGAVFHGTYAQITDYYKGVIAQYPNVARLIVPVAQFAVARDKTQTSGNLMHNCYREIAAAFKTKGVE